MAGELEDGDVDLAGRSSWRMVDWLYRNGEVIRRADNEDGGVSLALRMTAAARSDMETRLHRRNKGLQQ